MKSKYKKTLKVLVAILTGVALSPVISHLLYGIKERIDIRKSGRFVVTEYSLFQHLRVHLRFSGVEKYSESRRIWQYDATGPTGKCRFFTLTGTGEEMVKIYPRFFKQSVEEIWNASPVFFEGYACRLVVDLVQDPKDADILWEVQLLPDSDQLEYHRASTFFIFPQLLVGHLSTCDSKQVLAHEVGHAIGLEHPYWWFGLCNYSYAENSSEKNNLMSRGSCMSPAYYDSWRKYLSSLHKK